MAYMDALLYGLLDYLIRVDAYVLFMYCIYAMYMPNLHTMHSNDTLYPTNKHF